MQSYKLCTSDKHKVSLPTTTMTRVITPRSTHTKTKIPHMHIQKAPQPPRVQPYAMKPSIKMPPVPVGILWKSFPLKLPPPQKEVRKSLVNPNLKISQTLLPLDLPPPDTKETIEMYRPLDETLFRKPLPILKDAT